MPVGIAEDADLYQAPRCILEDIEHIRIRIDVLGVDAVPEDLRRGGRSA